MTEPEIKFCTDCVKSHDVGTEGAIDLRCNDPMVNHGSGLFLAGLVMSNKRCVAERNNVVGRCGKAGKRFVSKCGTIDMIEKQIPLPL